MLTNRSAPKVRQSLLEGQGHLLEDPLLDANDYEEYRWTLDLAARQVAADSLQADPNDQLAQRILAERLDAPLTTHADFFDHIWDRIAVFLQPHPTT